ncbi:hypothetical protein CF088_05465 [Clostridium botulinum]|uniref:MAE_28990/MAE_18760 family HEPN-like nuclease n=1 Tax=Clostridium botulinum TaxID=1491 RepID=UPI000774CFC0|nr:MAE_28990/MAE_18760 family HEPN-like nuclease [Clostridium botulinum]APH22416.1 hypothetical protein NPD1_3820 [Clostridium botulinum]APQ68080.1 hypothetical protein RSJ8_1947 [Clostridium botulinum]MBN3377653.1 hypothetical protein [Clostridium botulinum]MBN3404753.1 hypothetical protein [Clostridium botulinum]QDY17976.1 hypothetical protein CGQ27_13110 [Clostridium botulinum]
MTDILQDNLETFIDKIKNSLGARKKHIASLNDILNRLDNTLEKGIFMKVTVPELYAQYEGFFKYIFSETISFIKSLNIPNSNMKKEYLIFCLLTHLTENVRNQKTKAKKVINIFNNTFYENNNYLEIADFNEYILNLDSTQHTMQILGIDGRRLPMKGLNLLYQRRCEIAHGNISESNPFYGLGELNMNVEDLTYIYTHYWMEHYNCVIYSLEILSELFINYVITQKYIVHDIY